MLLGNLKSEVMPVCKLTVWSTRIYDRGVWLMTATTSYQ
jgi:hypothetical protein